MTDGSGRNHREYEQLKADRLGIIYVRSPAFFRMRQRFTFPVGQKPFGQRCAPSSMTALCV